LDEEIVVLVLTTILITAVVVVVLLNLTLGDKPVDKVIESLYAADSPQFTRTMGVLLGPPLVGGNRAEVLLNGHQIFPSMLEAIGRARRTITFETFIYWSGEIGRKFADALGERARAGVKVHVLIDWVGSQRMDEELLDTMKRAGVDVRRYHPLRWYTLARLNNRTHRKLMIVDGRIGFTGGVGIADEWSGDAQDPQHWRDTHFRVEGPVVGQMQAAFLDNWTEVTGVVLHGEDYFPALEPQGEHLAQMFTSSPGGGSESMQLMYLIAIAAAKKSIHLSASYFVPDEIASKMLVQALERGVRVRIILPGPLIDQSTVRKASRARWGPLLRAGAEIHEFQPTMFHCKVMVVDEVWTSVGSTNFDNRSFAVNDEANLNVFDAAFARRQIEIFRGDLQHARRITLEEWEKRPWGEKLREHAAGLIGSQL
jgi:cardiolipin synthase